MSLRQETLMKAHALALAFLARVERSSLFIEPNREETKLLCTVVKDFVEGLGLVSRDDDPDGPLGDDRFMPNRLVPVEGDALVGTMTRDEEAQEFADHHGLPYLAKVGTVAKTDVTNILETDPIYGGSWQKRGGVGAFMMLCRKWDRLEERVKNRDWNIFRAIQDDTRREGVIDDVRDLRRYLMLVEAKAISDGIAALQSSSKDSVKT